MKVQELIEHLGRYDPSLEIELVIVCPVDRAGDEVNVDRYSIEAITDWPDDELDADVVWLVGGEERDVDAFEEAMGFDDHDHDEHDHDGHDHDGHDHDGHDHDDGHDHPE